MRLAQQMTAIVSAATAKSCLQYDLLLHPALYEVGRALEQHNKPSGWRQRRLDLSNRGWAVN